MNARPVLILAGGTGGHVFPGLAVAAALAERAVPVHWLGGQGLESRLVPAAGIPFTALPGRGLRGAGIGRKLSAPPRLAVAVAVAWRLMRRLGPRAAIGFGGYASGAGGLAAGLAGCPLVVHEQNAVAGFTNRVLARFAARVLTGLPGAFGDRAELAGNPVRESFREIAVPAVRLRDRSGPLRLAVIGGSQGARALNRTVPAALARCAHRFEVRHLCGDAHLEQTRDAYQAHGITAVVRGFEDDMAGLCAWADVALARAGALTLAEFAVAGLPAILVPFPWAVDDHQTANARVFVAAGAAQLLPESELTPARLATELDALAAAGRGRLREMSERARRLGRPDAAERVALAALEVGEGAA